MNRYDEHDARPDGSDQDGCERALERLPLFVGGDLDARDEAEVREHLTACAPCAARADRMRGAFDAYFATQHREAADEMAGAGLWPELRERLFGGAATGDAPRPSGVGEPVVAPGAREGHGGGAAYEPLEDDIAWEVAGAGTIDPAGVRGPRALRLLFGGVGLAAGVVLTAMVLWKQPRWDGAADEPNAGGAPIAAETVGGDGTVESGGHARDAALADGGPATTTPDAALADGGPATGGLTPIAPEDDAQRLIRGGGTAEELRWRLAPSGGSGHSLAGSNQWR